MRAALARRWFSTGRAILTAAAAGCFALPVQIGAAEKVDSFEADVLIDSQTKSVIDGALKYLASKQQLNGSWAIKEGSAGHPVGITGYVLLAFMAAGNLPDEGEYSKNVTAGMRFLLDSIQPDGIFRGVAGGQYMYNHGVATIALAELYGESNSPAIRVKLERLINVILKAQNKEGGWRYTPRSTDADISATVIQAVALRAALNVGISVPEESLNRAIGYVNSCFVPAKGGFAYQPGKEAGFARTAAAIYSLQVLGKYDDPKIKPASDYLFANMKSDAWFTYGHYYAAPAQYMIGGDTWKKWYADTKKILMEFVQRDGSTAYWDPAKKDKHGSTYGPVYATAVYIHILAMPYHFVPLYQR